MWVFIWSLSSWAQGVQFAVSKPGVVHVSAPIEGVFVPACRGVSWALFDVETERFEPTAPTACGPAESAIAIDKAGVEFELDVPLPPLPEVGFHILQPTVIVGRKCRTEAPFYLAGCKDLQAVKGPQMLIRSRGPAALSVQSKTD